MQVELTTWERVMLKKIIGGLRGTVAIIRVAARLLDILEFTPAERKTLGLVATEQGLIHWHATERAWPMAIMAPEQQTLLRTAVQQFEGWQTTDLPHVEALYTKLGLSF